MREIGLYAGILYLALNLISLVSIFLFDYYETKWSPSFNAILAAMLAVPVALVSGLGYAISAYVRDRARADALDTYRCAAIGALGSTVLAFGTPLIERLLPMTYGPGVMVGYFFVVGTLAPWFYVLWKRASFEAA